MKLGYIVIEVRRLARWRTFAEEVLGLPQSVVNTDGSRGYRVDHAAQRLVLQPGSRDDLAAIGLEMADEAAFGRLLERLEPKAAEGAPALCRARRVRRLAHFEDPEGNRLEAVLGVERGAEPFRSPHYRDKFGTDSTGFGHAVIVARDLVAMERFYVATLGFAVSERLDARVGPLRVQGVFLHCNRRHHTLALMSLPSRKRLQHFMLEASSPVDVARAYERARAHGVPMSLGLGQHPDPDGTFSFYGCTPSGIDFEIGAGGREIEPAGWRVLSSDTTSAWGHQPTLGLKLRAASGLIAARLGF